MSTRLKTLAHLVIDQSDQGELPYLALEHLVGGTGALEPQAELPIHTGGEQGSSAVRPGDVLFGKLRPYLAKTFLISEPAYASTELMALRPASSMESRYLAYLVGSRPLIDWATASSEGTRMPRTSWEKLGAFRVETVPTLKHQRAIADYLDTETTRIDALITKKLRIVELVHELGERKEEQIALAVQSAKRIPVSFLFRITKGINAQRLTAEYCAAHQGEYPVYSGQTSGVFGSIDEFDFAIPNGAIVVSTVGARVMSQALVRGKFSLSQNCLVMIPQQPEELVLELFVPQLRQLFDRLRSQIPDHMQPSLRVEDLRGKWLSVPSLNNQAKAALEIAALNEKVLEVRRKLSSQIDLLREYRQALITAAVTGEFEVPGVAA